MTPPLPRSPAEVLAYAVVGTLALIVAVVALRVAWALAAALLALAVLAVLGVGLVLWMAALALARGARRLVAAARKDVA